MYTFALRLLAFVSFVGWCISANRAHRYTGPDDGLDDDEREYDDALHTEGFA
jgi:hypothetical protein